MCVSQCNVFFFHSSHCLKFLLSPPPDNLQLQVQSKAICEQHRHITCCQNSLPFTLAGLYLLLSSALFSLPLLISLSSPMAVSRQTYGQCAPDAPLTRPHPAACHCSLLCSIQTDGIAISTGFSFCLSPCLPHATLSILSSSFLCLTKWKIITERENGKRERERERDTGFAADIWAKAQGFPERHPQ